MSAVPTVAVELDPPSPEQLQFRRWWRSRLIERGVPPVDARLLSETGRVDLHEALELLDRGCPPATLARLVL